MPDSCGSLTNGGASSSSARRSRYCVAETGNDLVNVFRRPEAVGEAVDQAIAAGAKALWMQLGIRNDAACAEAEAAGLKVVMNRCISVEPSRLMRCPLPREMSSRRGSGNRM